MHPKYNAPDSLDTDYQASIEHEAVGSSVWAVYQNGDWLGDSTDQFTTAAASMVTGSETTNNNSRTDAVSKALAWRGAAGNFNSGWEDGANHSGKIVTGDYGASWNIPYSKLSYSVHHTDC